MDKIVSWLLEPFSMKKEVTPQYKIEEQREIVKKMYIQRKKKKIVTQPITPRPKIKKKNNYTFNNYIGQTKIKNILSSYIKRKEVLPHVLVHGNAGCGKTTLARTIANELGVKYNELIAKSIIDPKDLIEKITKLRGGILFIDELHGLSRDKAEIIYSVMEDFKYNGKKIRPFTLIGATTEYGELLRSRRPFVDRFKINLELENYDIPTIQTLLKNYNSAKFPEEILSDSVILEISKNCRLTPRLGIRLLEATICFNSNYSEVFSNFNIVKDGYTKKDIKTLEYLSHNKVCGIDSIASYLNIPKQSYLYEVEPYLLQNGLILRKSTGRTITQAGLSLLNSINVESTKK